MARFFMECRGKGKAVHRLGHSTGHVSVRGWNAGVDVHANVDECNHITFEVILTGGSNGCPYCTLGRVHFDEGSKECLWEAFEIPSEFKYPPMIAPAIIQEDKV